MSEKTPGNVSTYSVCVSAANAYAIASSASLRSRSIRYCTYSSTVVSTSATTPAPTTDGTNAGTVPIRNRENGIDTTNNATIASALAVAQRRSPAVAGAVAMFSIARLSNVLMPPRAPERG